VSLSRASDLIGKIYFLSNQVRKTFGFGFRVSEPTNLHWARVVGYRPFFLCVIHGLRPTSGDINKLMLIKDLIFASDTFKSLVLAAFTVVSNNLSALGPRSVVKDE
jgi:hypothetical protein